MTKIFFVDEGTCGFYWECSFSWSLVSSPLWFTWIRPKMTIMKMQKETGDRIASPTDYNRQVSCLDRNCKLNFHHQSSKENMFYFNKHRLNCAKYSSGNTHMPIRSACVFLYFTTVRITIVYCRYNIKIVSVMNLSLLYSDYSVLILGAGIAGIRAAQLLSEAGANIQIIEGSDRIGGIWLIFNRYKKEFNYF